MKRQILASTLGLVILLSACSAETNSNRKDVSSLTENVSESTTMAVMQERENTTENGTADAISDVPEVSNVPEASDIPEGKTTLVLGGIGLSGGQLASLVNNFNSENTKYTVILDDYAENTESPEQAGTVMRTKMLAGDSADIYYFRSDILSPIPWISAGLLYDLDPLIASDSEISKEDIIPWTAMHEYGGLYLLSPTFGVVALSCSQQTQKLHTGWTIAEYLDIEKSLRPEQDRKSVV